MTEYKTKKDDHQATDEAIAVMRSIGSRGLNAEKMAWTLRRLMLKRPVEHHTHHVLAQELHDYLINTACMIKSIRYLNVGENGSMVAERVGVDGDH